MKLFGRQLYFNFEHFIFEYKVLKKSHCVNFLVEKIGDQNINEIDMGYFRISMLNNVLKKNKQRAEGFLFRNESDLRAVGFVLLAYKGAKEIHYKIRNTDAYIVALGVMPSYRGKGFSQDILSYTANLCYSKGYKSIKLAVDSNNTPAINSYKKFGFVFLETRTFKRFLGMDFLKDKNL